MAITKTVRTKFNKLNGVLLSELTKDATKFPGGPIKSLPLEYSFSKLEETDEVPAKEIPDEKGIRSYANGRRNMKARSKAQNAAAKAAGIDAPTVANSPQKAEAVMVDALLKQKPGMTREAATQRIRAMLGAE